MLTKHSQSESSDDHQPGTAGRIIVLNNDLFFGVKIGNILRSIGYTVVFVKTTQAFAQHLSEDGALVALGIIDINAGVDWPAIAAWTSEPENAIPLLAFGSHLDVDGLRSAKAAGVRRVVSNGDFHRDMVKLVIRYANSASPPRSPVDG